MCDQERISPYNINTVSSRKVIRVNQNINQGIISCFNTKFSEQTLLELCGRQWGELLMRS